MDHSMQWLWRDSLGRIVPLCFLVLPVIAGIIAGKRLGRFTSWLLMMFVFQALLVMFIFLNTGLFQPVVFIPGVAILPGIGRYSGVSPGGLVYPLIFILVAIRTSRGRYVNSVGSST